MNSKQVERQMSDPIIMVATFTAKPEHYEELKSRLLEMVEYSRKESGCMFYDLHEDRRVANTFSFLEGWESQDDLDRHDQTTHVKAIIADAPRLTADGIHVRFMKRVMLRNEQSFQN
jgi:quinol monooxygenase YgiN